MTTAADFLTSVQKGREAATEADTNRREIQAVLDELGEQLNKMSPDHKLVVTRTSRTGPGEGSMPRGMTHLFEPPPRKYTALVVKTDRAERDLCEFEEGSRGYPVELRYAKTVVGLEDRESLVAALRYLLETPHVGRIFNELLGAPAAPAALPADADAP
jgi:hypothetical protein